MAHDQVHDAPYPNCIRECIKTLGYSMSEVAAETGIPRRTLTNYCAGVVPVPRRVVQLVAGVLGCSEDALVPMRAVLRRAGAHDVYHVLQSDGRMSVQAL